MTAFWVTKHALTKGIQYEEGCTLREGYVTRASRFCTSIEYLFVKLGKDAFETEAEAKANAVKKAKAQLKSLDKSRMKIEQLLKQWDDG